ncbi:hypothetical protein IWZ01DRAFT_342770 [Phyllosticta capitalensis]
MTHRSLDLAQAHVHATLPTCRYIQKHPLPHAPHHLRSRITKLPSSPVPADPKIPHVPPSGPLQPAHRHLSSALLPTTTLISSYTLLCLHSQYLEVLLKINLPLQNQLRHPNHQHSPNNNQTKTRHGTHPQILCRHRPAPLHDALRHVARRHFAPAAAHRPQRHHRRRRAALRAPLPPVPAGKARRLLHDQTAHRLHTEPQILSQKTRRVLCP